MCLENKEKSKTRFAFLIKSRTARILNFKAYLYLFKRIYTSGYHYSFGQTEIVYGVHQRWPHVLNNMVALFV